MGTPFHYLCKSFYVYCRIPEIKFFIYLFSPPVSPAITASFSDNAEEECLDFPLIIQQDTAPVVLVVNVTADPCPQVNWYINDTLITGGTSGIEVSYGCVKCVWMILCLVH